VKCASVSKAYNTYGDVNNQRSVAPKWTPIFKKVSFIDDPEFKRVPSALDQIEKEGKKLTKWELCVVVKELRKFKRFKPALEVYEWMNNRVGRFELSSSDYVKRSPYTYIYKKKKPNLYISNVYVDPCGS